MAGEIVTVPDQSSQTNVKPMGSISILLVDDDTTCLAIVAAMIKKWKYNVVTVKHPLEALCTLRGRQGTFDLVVTDVHMPDMNGFQLQEKIDEEFNLPVVFMSADDQESVMLRGLQSGAAFFLLKPISPNDLKNLWQYAVAKRKPRSARTEAIEITPACETSLAGKQASNDPGRNYPVQGTSENDKGSNEQVGSGSSLRIEDRTGTNYSKRKFLVNFEEEENDQDDFGNPKKPKVVWTHALHNQFLEAIRCVGIERAVPKKILELMNVPGLTRENIASHLQKYRIFLKRVSEASRKIQSASERSKIERTFRSNFAAAQPYLKPNFGRAQLGKSLLLQPNLSYSDPKFGSSTAESPPMFGSGQSRLLLNQTIGSPKPLYHQQRNFSPLRMDPTVVHPTGMLLNANGNISGGILENFVQPYQQKDFLLESGITNDHNGNISGGIVENFVQPYQQKDFLPESGIPNDHNGNISGGILENFVQPYQQKDFLPESGGITNDHNGNISGGILENFVQPYQQNDFLVLESCTTNDHNIAGYGNIGGFSSSNLNLTPNHMGNNAGYVGYRLAGDGRLVGLSADLNPDHGSTNVVQSESPTSNVPLQLVGLSDDLNPNHGLINVVQSEITSNAPVQLAGLSDDHLNLNHWWSNVGQTGSTSNVPAVLDDPNHVLINGVQSEITRYLPAQLVGLSANFNLNHGSINVVQSGSTCDFGALNDSFDDYNWGQGVCPTGLESGCFVLPTLDNVVQDGNTSAMPLSPSVLGENAFEINEGGSDSIFSLLDDNVLNSSICEVDGNPNFLQTYGECDFDILNDINFIQPPIQDNVEVLDYAFSSSPDDHAENIPIANDNQCLEQPLGPEMMFSDLGMDGVDDYFQAYDQTFDQSTFPQLEDEDFLDTVLFGNIEFNGYDMP